MHINSKKIAIRRFKPNYEGQINTPYIWEPDFLEKHFKEHREQYSHVIDGWIRPFMESKVVPFDIVGAKIFNVFDIIGILYISNIIDGKPVYSVALPKKPINIMNPQHNINKKENLTFAVHLSNDYFPNPILHTAQYDHCGNPIHIDSLEFNNDIEGFINFKTNEFYYEVKRREDKYSSQLGRLKYEKVKSSIVGVMITDTISYHEDEQPTDEVDDGWDEAQKTLFDIDGLNEDNDGDLKDIKNESLIDFGKNHQILPGWTYNLYFNNERNNECERDGDVRNHHNKYTKMIPPFMYDIYFDIAEQPLLSSIKAMITFEFFKTCDIKKLIGNHTLKGAVILQKTFTKYYKEFVKHCNYSKMKNGCEVLDLLLTHMTNHEEMWKEIRQVDFKNDHVAFVFYKQIVLKVLSSITNAFKNIQEQDKKKENFLQCKFKDFIQEKNLLNIVSKFEKEILQFRREIEGWLFDEK